MGILSHIKAAAGKPSVEVPHSHHAVVVQPPQVKREEYPFTGFIDFQGLKVDVENRKGDYRRGKDKDGHEWKVLMHSHYGEIRDTEGVDGDNLDVYVGPNHDASTVVVIRQHRPDTGAYDEDKVMVGFDSVEEAIGAYKKQYDKPGFYKEGDYLAMPIGRFWRWVHDERKQGRKVAAVLGHSKIAVSEAMQNRAAEARLHRLAAMDATAPTSIATQNLHIRSGDQAANILRMREGARSAPGWVEGRRLGRPGAERAVRPAPVADAVHASGSLLKNHSGKLLLGAGALAAGGLAYKAYADKKQAVKAAAALPDIIRPTIQPQHWEYALHPSLKKALIAMGAGAGAGAVAKKVHDAHQEEKETGLPSKLKRGVLYGLGGAALGAGGAHLFARKIVPAVRAQTAPSAEVIIRLVADMRATGRPDHEIAEFLKTTPGVRDHLRSAQAGAGIKDHAERLKVLAPAALGGLVGLRSSVYGATSARDDRERTQELADAFAGRVLDKNRKANAPSDDLLLHPDVTPAMGQAAFSRHGEEATRSSPSLLKNLLGGGAIGGGLAATSLASAIGKAAPIVRMSGGSMQEFVRKTIKSPGVLAGLGAATAVGAGLGGLNYHFANKEKKEWSTAAAKGPDALRAKAEKEHASAVEWLHGYKLSKNERRQQQTDAQNARRYVTYRAKTAEHVETPGTPLVVEEALRPVLASLLALYQIYYFAHWSSRGESAYGDHQLFERLYKSTQEEFDSVAERVVGHCGEDALGGVFTLAAQLNEQWMLHDTPLGGAITGENATQSAILGAYRSLDVQAGLTLGLDDLLMQLASQHETNLYLLRQRSKPQIGAAANSR